MSKPQFSKRSKRAFTLVELILGMTILALVLVSAYAMLDTAMTAYRTGVQSMEMYQSARIGLRRVADELRFSLSPNAFWEPDTTIRIEPEEVYFSINTIPVIEERDPGKIVFSGSKNEVTFTRKVYRLGSPLPFDLQLCKIHVDQERQQLLLTVMKSLLTIKRAAWWYAYEFEAPLAGFTFASRGTTDTRFRTINNPEIPPVPLEIYLEGVGIVNKSYLLSEHIASIEFRYADSANFEDKWSSSEIVKEYRISTLSPQFNAATDIKALEKGPPQVIEIKMELSNGETLITSTDIPAGNMSNFGSGFGGGGGGGSPSSISSGGQAPGSYSESQFNIPAVPVGN